MAVLLSAVQDRQALAFGAAHVEFVGSSFQIRVTRAQITFARAMGPTPMLAGSDRSVHFSC